MEMHTQRNEKESIKIVANLNCKKFLLFQTVQESFDDDVPFYTGEINVAEIRQACSYGINLFSTKMYNFVDFYEILLFLWSQKKYEIH